MNENIKSQLDVFALCRRGANLEGTYPLRPVAKLTGKLEDSTESVYLKLDFYQDEKNLNVVDIAWKTTALVSCERCLTPFPLDLSAHNQLAVYRSSKSSEDTPDHYDPLIVHDGEMMSVDELLAEEILLALPLIVRHETDSCKAKLDLYTKDNEEDTHQPFANLDLKLS